MASAQCGGKYKCPLFTDNPLVVLDKVGIGQDGVQGEKRCRVEVRVPRYRSMQARSRNFSRPHRYGDPMQ
jgi:hypothetical protein